MRSGDDEDEGCVNADKVTRFFTECEALVVPEHSAQDDALDSLCGVVHDGTWATSEVGQGVSDQNTICRHLCNRELNYANVGGNQDRVCSSVPSYGDDHLHFWSGTPLECVLGCAALDPPSFAVKVAPAVPFTAPDGSIRPSCEAGAAPGDTCLHACNPGTYPVGGSFRRRCVGVSFFRYNKVSALDHLVDNVACTRCLMEYACT